MAAQVLPGQGGSHSDKKQLIDEADKTAEDFVQIYYEKLDSKRNTINKIYLETAVLSWNGNKIEGKDLMPSKKYKKC